METNFLYECNQYFIMIQRSRWHFGVIASTDIKNKATIIF